MLDKNIKFDAIVERHSTWLAVNPIQGCVNNCLYCFMNQKSLTKVKPQVLIEWNKVIDEIKNNKYYTQDVPICYFSKTDIMVLDYTREYLINLIDSIMRSDIYNPFVIVTKCFIPDNIIAKLKQLQKTGREVLVYISYSGLDKDIEKGIEKENALKNFERLFENNIKILHYFRPLIPQNSSKEMFELIIGYVSKYSIASVVTGLKVYKELQHQYTFWNEITEIDNAFEYECIWPYHVEEDLKVIAEKYNYSIYQSNSCALEYALNGFDKYGLYQSDVCTNFNICDAGMRERCKCFSGKGQVDLIDKLLNQIGYNNVDYEIKENKLYVYSHRLSNEDICFIGSYIRMPIVNLAYNNSYYTEDYWNNAFNNSKQLFLDSL